MYTRNKCIYHVDVCRVLPRPETIDETHTHTHAANVTCIDDTYFRSIHYLRHITNRRETWIIFTRALTGCNKTVPDRLEKWTALRVAGEIFIVRSFHIVHAAIMAAVSAHKRNIDKLVTAERDGVINVDRVKNNEQTAWP